MLYHLFYPLSKYSIVFNVLKYITFRSGCAFVTSFLLTFILWKQFKRMKLFDKFGFYERIDMYGHPHLENLHKDKKGTPTMGGLIIIISVIISVFIWMRWNIGFSWYTLIVMLFLGGVGFKDDLLKIKKGKGLSRGVKLVSQVFIGIVVGLIIYIRKDISTRIDLPFFKNMIIDLGYFYIFWASLVIVATSNAVNFTDGLDGLAIGGIISSSLVFAILSYVCGNIKFSHYLFIPYIKNAGELTILCSSILGASLGFLWYNCYPAEVFMGDTGALSLGGLLGAVALFIKKEFLLIICGGVFVVEALSVVLQIASVKIRGKKMFRAAPLHHHFQIRGIPEAKIIVRFWIIYAILAVVALLTLKLR